MATITVPQSVYQKRRDKIFKRLAVDRDIVVLFNAPNRNRSFDNDFLHRTDSSFYYLTGLLNEPNAVLVMWRNQEKSKVVNQTAVFVRPKDRTMEQWEGPRIGPKGAQKLLKATHSGAVADLEKFLVEEISKISLAGNRPNLRTNATGFHGVRSRYHEFENFLKRVVEQLRSHSRAGWSPLESISDVTFDIYEDRLIKDKWELAIMRESSRINVEAHLDVLRNIKSGAGEGEAAAIVEYGFKKRGASGPSYNSICATGANACCLHYDRNNQTMKSGQMFLIDAGCEYQMYASDITRTYPVNGKFTKEQKEIYEIVLKAELECIKMSKPGVVYEKIHQKAVDVIVEGLRKLKLLKGTKQAIMKSASYRRYFPHGTGHWMGLDVHDPCPYRDSAKKSLRLKPGMVFTVEPGIYFMADDKTVPKKYRGIGVRIEDDILVTKGKPENLTAGLLKTVKDIEEFMSN